MVFLGVLDDLCGKTKVIAPVGNFSRAEPRITIDKKVLLFYRSLCDTASERERAIRGVAGSTPVGLARDKRTVENLQDRKAILRPGDLGNRESDATRDLLSAKTFEDIIEMSEGLYAPPDQCRMR